jgi:hypothetical protein
MRDNTQGAPRKIGQNLFIGFLVIHILSCYFMGMISLVDPKFAFETGFQMTYNPDLQIIGIVMGMELLFLGSIALLGVIWTRRKSKYGIYAGVAVGSYMFLFGIVAFLIMGRTDGLIVDSIRGLLTLIFGYMAYQELKRQTLSS